MATSLANNLSWTAPTGTDLAASYNVYRGTVSGGPYTKIASTVTGTTYSDTSGTSGTAYYYVVTAVDANGNESADSNQASAVFPSVPNAPTNLTATAS